jgi:hypothetical protein
LVIDPVEGAPRQISIGLKVSKASFQNVIEIRDPVFHQRVEAPELLLGGSYLSGQLVDAVLDFAIGCRPLLNDFRKESGDAIGNQQTIGNMPGHQLV